MRQGQLIKRSPLCVAILLGLLGGGSVTEGGWGGPDPGHAVAYIPLNNLMTCDEEGAVGNDTFIRDLGPPGPGWGAPDWWWPRVKEIGWNDVDQTAGLDTLGQSWLSEMVVGIDFDGDGQNDVYITPSSTDAPGTELGNTSGDWFNLVANGLPLGHVYDNKLRIELFESYDDEPGVCEGVFSQFGLLIHYRYVPEPSQSPLLLLGAIGLMLSCRRRK